ncbi:MAG TPA: hypothetical protein VJ788_02770 [Gemmatimonadota bacterium]|nr:hypothetical protein [Gemmatimonadota bacterium]
MTFAQDRVIRRVFEEWSAEVAARVEVERRFLVDEGERSQYGEAPEALSADPRDDAEFHRRVQQALIEAGLPQIP